MLIVVHKMGNQEGNNLGLVSKFNLEIYSFPPNESLASLLPGRKGNSLISPITSFINMMAAERQDEIYDGHCVCCWLTTEHP